MPISFPFDAVTVTMNPAIDCAVTIPAFTPGAVNRVESVHNTAGGKGVNVAASLADDGREVAVTGFLGSENSAIFEAFFHEKGITDRFVRIDGETRTGIKITDPKSCTTTDINFPGKPPKPDDLNTLRHAVEALKAPWYILGGSLPPGVPTALYRDLVKALKELGRNVVLDTSEEPLQLAIDADPTIVKPNIDELECLIGERLEDEKAIIKAAKSLVERGIGMAVVSMGKEGACFVTRDETVIARPPDVEIQSTVGAGDALVAGIVSAQIQGLPLTACAKLATAFSVYALTRKGEPRQEFARGIAEILPRVVIQ